MSDKPNLAQDFEQVDRAADDALLRMLKQESGGDDGNGTRPGKPKASAATRRTEKRSTDVAGSHAHTRKSTAVKRKDVESPKAITWSRPTALFNTRIPVEMAELLDDLLYRLRKDRRGSGVAVTKQALAQEAFEDLLRKYRLVA
jgi:hypothetical protein